MKIAMIGAGYVGLTTGACLAELGHHVTCFDTDAAKVQRLSRGEIPIYEPGLAELIGSNFTADRLHFSTDLIAAVGEAEAVFLAVGTPSRSDGSIDLSQVERAARTIAPALRRDAVIVIKSTVIAGTARRLRDIVAEARGGLDFAVASNPEFLREGSAVSDFMQPDRVVIGTDDRMARAVLERVYAPLTEAGVRVVLTTTINAEMIKYAANAMLALKIGFINEMANLCEAVGGDVRAVAEGIGLDRRIGPGFLAAGPGFGGSCFPKDTRALAALGRQHQAPLALVETLIEGNEARKAQIADRVLDALGRRTLDSRIAIFGVSFKANTDDARESAAASIVPLLLEAGCVVAAHDPKANRSALDGAVWHDDVYAAAQGAHAVVVLTEWQHYAALDLAKLRQAMAGDLLFDCRNIIDPDAAAAAGLRLVAIGRSQPATPARVVSRDAGASRRRAAASPA